MSGPYHDISGSIVPVVGILTYLGIQKLRGILYHVSVDEVGQEVVVPFDKTHEGRLLKGSKGFEEAVANRRNLGGKRKSKSRKSRKRKSRKSKSRRRKRKSRR